MIRSMFAALLTLQASFALAAEADWIEKSNQNAQALLEITARYAPEQASQVGVEGHDAEVFDLKPRFIERQVADLQAAAQTYAGARSARPIAACSRTWTFFRRRSRSGDDARAESQVHAAVLRHRPRRVRRVPGSARRAHPEGAAEGRAVPPASLRRRREGIRADHAARSRPLRGGGDESGAARSVGRRSETVPGEPAALSRRHRAAVREAAASRAGRRT